MNETIINVINFQMIDIWNTALFDGYMPSWLINFVPSHAAPMQGMAITIRNSLIKINPSVQ